MMVFLWEGAGGLKWVTGWEEGSASPRGCVHLTRKERER